MPHLAKVRPFRPPPPAELGAPPDRGDENDGQASTAAAQDDYVLARLFAKSGGIHSALRHDAIVDDDGTDHALLEAEAAQAAKAAVRALRESRRECARPGEWSAAAAATGGELSLSKKRFGQKRKTAGGGEGSSGSGGHQLMTSADLLARIKARNRVVAATTMTTAVAEEEDSLFFPAVAAASRSEDDDGFGGQNSDLLADIRNFIAFQAQADGEASTAELVSRFRRSLPPQQSPLFKALLQQICNFRREDARGMWRLKREFR